MKKKLFFCFFLVTLLISPKSVYATTDSNEIEKDQVSEEKVEVSQSMAEETIESETQQSVEKNQEEKKEVMTPKKRISPVESRSLRLARVGVSDLPGARDPDKKGIYLLFPMRVGIISQPQEEQYLVKGESADLSIRTTSWLNPFSKVSVDVREWSEDGNGGWVNNGIIGTFKSSRSGLLGSSEQSIDIPIGNLQEGRYYFQLETKLNKFPVIGGLGANWYYSNLAKVEVKKEPISANRVSITTPKVVFEQATYPVKAVTNPVDATVSMNWFSSLNVNEIELLSDTGRSIEFRVKNQLPAVNKSTDKPGIPFNITATATNNNGGSVSDGKTIYLGGLSAKKVAQDSGFSWDVDEQALLDLDGAVENNQPWNYQWQYIDETGIKSFKPSDGANNNAGTLSSLTDLNEQAHLLTFKRDSEFMSIAKKATDQGKPFAVQVSFSTVIETGDDKTETVTITSNKAQLEVSKPEGKLSLQQVPDFNFGTIPGSYVYEGTKGREPSAKGKLIISDTRYPSNGWYLNAKMSPLKNKEEQPLENASELQLKASDIDVSLTDNNKEIVITDSTKSEESDLVGSLQLQENPRVQLKPEDIYSSTITWTLIPAVVKANPA